MDLFDEFSTPPPINDQPLSVSENGTRSMEKRVRKLRKSCELCRNSKGRCIPSKERGHCQRCAKEGKECIFLEAKPRPKRAKNSRIRVAEMEEKLDSLVALLTNAQHTTKPITPPSDESSLIDSLMYKTPQGTEDQLFDQSQSRVFESIQHPFPPAQPAVPYGNTCQYSALQFSDYVFQELQDPISKNIISFEQAEESVKLFRSKAASFPWVILPKNTSLDTLRRERPFLLLSLLTSEARRDLKMQCVLEGELKESLMKKVIALGEKSLDLLQGLLLYIASYHFYFSPDRQQIYQLCQMAVSMTVDLGINKKSRELSQQAIQIASRHVSSQSSQCPNDIEQRRTFLGCYYICASICQGLRKPRNIRYTDYVNDCCQTLALMKDNKTDRIIPYFVRLQRFGDDVTHAFDYDGSSDLPELDPIRIEAFAKTFHDQLKQFEASFPTEVWNNATLKLTFLSQRIYANEISCHAIKPPPDIMGVSSPDQRSWYHSASRNESLVRLMHAAKDYFDYLLSITSEQVQELTFSDFITMIYSVLVIGTFKSYRDAPTLDIDHVRRIADVDVYIPAMMIKFNDVASKQVEASYSPYLCQVTGLLGHYKTRFQEAATYSSLGKASEHNTPNRFGFEDMMPTILKRCIEWDDLVSLGGQQQVPPCVDEWEQVLANWPNSFDPSVMPIDSSLSL